jgi:ABC-type nickel/cobalt efflux system permease component RcnA
MSDGISFLCGTAAVVGLVHTLLGPDHYVPFVAMSRAGGWSIRKTIVVTLSCGLAHVLSSVALGVIGIGMGVAVFKLKNIESIRGDIAGWLLTGFGLAYFVWGVRRAIANKPHTHFHPHTDGTVHSHTHVHDTAHAHVHFSEYAEPRAECNPGLREARANNIPPPGATTTTSLTPWVLFTIFGFGPCEPLIPIVMYPAAAGSAWGVVIVTAIFGAATISTMMAMVLIGHRAMDAIPLGRLERYSHALAGFALLACGVAIQAGL